MPFPLSQARRIHYDRDGTVGYYYAGGASTNPTGFTQVSAQQLQTWNSSGWNTAFGFGGSGYTLGLVFPSLRDILGIFHANDTNYGSNLQTSVDTTNMVDGTWVTQYANTFPVSANSAQGYYRLSPGYYAVNFTGIKSIRFYAAYSDMNFHLYGGTSAGQNPDRIQFWDPTIDQELPPNALTPGNQGDVVRGQTYSMSFRIKNNSATKTATNITISTEAIPDNNPPVAGMTTYSYGGSAFANTAVIPSLGPGLISGIVSMNVTIASNAQLLVCNPRVNATVQTMA